MFYLLRHMLLSPVYQFTLVDWGMFALLMLSLVLLVEGVVLTVTRRSEDA
jgi:hypothetical protein